MPDDWPKPAPLSRTEPSRLGLESGGFSMTQLLDPGPSTLSQGAKLSRGGHMLPTLSLET